MQMKRTVLGFTFCLLTMTATIAYAGDRKIAKCYVLESDQVSYDAKCYFVKTSKDGSFSLLPLRGKKFLINDEIISLGVSIMGQGKANVRGLTADGINSNWGDAIRDTKDRACWIGDGFKICAR
jgi:hypothetical protein